ncbi:MAG: glutathione peroxidase [Salibacteraceae bacterium]
MKTLIIAFILAFIAVPGSKSVYDFTMNDIDGEPVKLQQFEGRVLLIVNVASECGLTPQYADIEPFYQAYKEKGLTVLGFPANNFGQQEPGNDEEIKAFCSAEYSVTFPMFSKISVKGEDIHPLYAYLTSGKFDGAMNGPVKWNFQKYLVDKQGRVRMAFHPKTSVKDEAFVAGVEKLLSE